MMTVPVHFAVGLLATAALGGAVALVRHRRGLRFLPLAATLGGAWAVVPDIVTFLAAHLGRSGAARLAESVLSHSPLMNVFFLYPQLDRVAWLRTQAVSDAAFQVVAFFYFVAACAYVVQIRWGLPKLAEWDEAASRMRRAVAGYGALGALAGILPLALAGVAVGAVVYATVLPRAAVAARTGEWDELVSSRMRVGPLRQLGFVRALPKPDAGWVAGDLWARSTFGGGTEPLLSVIEHAKNNGCGFVVLADEVRLGTDRRAAYGRDLVVATAKFPEVAILAGLVRQEAGALVIAARGGEGRGARGEGKTEDKEPSGLAPPASGPGSEGVPAWLAGLGPAEAAFSMSGPDTGEGSDELFRWLRASDALVGLLGLAGPERAASGTRDRWDPRVARVGGVWDRLLGGGFQLWGAAAGSGFRDPKTHFWPGEFAQTHLRCRGRSAADVLAALREGCFWAEEGGIVRDLDFRLVADEIPRPAQMGEIICVRPGSEIDVELALDIPPKDRSGRANRIDGVELISNFGGAAKVVREFGRVVSGQRVRFSLPPAADNASGAGFFVRARGRRRLEDGSELAFYTNPIRVLVREGLETPAEARPAVARVEKPPRETPTPESPSKANSARPASPAQAEGLEAIGLPRTVDVLRLERFAERPGREWRGTWLAHVEQRGAAMGDEKLDVRYIEKTPLGDATRLFFRVYAIDCTRLTLRVHTTASGRPYQAVRELPDRHWADFDFSLPDDLFPPEGAPSRLCAPTEILAIEWHAEPSGPQASFHVADFVLYEPTAASRLASARRRAEQADAILREVRSAPGGGRSWRARAEDARVRLSYCRDRLKSLLGDPTGVRVAAAQRELDDIAESCRRLSIQAAMERTFGLYDPPFAVAVEGAAQRVSGFDPGRVAHGRVGRQVELWAAAGEAESFQLVVLSLWEPLRAVDVTWSDLRREEQPEAKGIPAPSLSAHVVGEVWVYPRADLPPDRTGWKADPLLPALPFDVGLGSLRSVLLTVHVASDVPPGTYQGTITVRPHGLEPVRLTLRVHRWDFALTDNYFPIVARIDERALREQFDFEKTVPDEVRQDLYETLLRHRVAPVPLLGRDEATDLAELTFCLERGLRLAVLRELAQMAAPEDPGVAYAARLAAKISEAGWGRRGALLLPFARDDSFVKPAVALSRRWPLLHFIAGGEGEPPVGLIATYWRRLLTADAPALPQTDDLEVRRSRTTWREAWELNPGAPDYPQPNATLANLLAETRSLPWLAWRYGIRALFLPGVTRWENNNLGDGLLVYPGPAGGFYPSLRLVALRDGAEDYECLRLLWDRAQRLRERSPGRHLQLLAAVDQMAGALEPVITRFQSPCRDPEALAGLRLRLGNLVERVEAAWWVEVDGADDLPSPPESLKATLGPGLVKLAWPRSADEKAVAYNVYRSCDAKTGFVRINPNPVEGLTFEDRTARENARSYYFVRAARETGIEGPRSVPAEAVLRPEPWLVWLPMAKVEYSPVGPFRVLLRVQRPGALTEIPLVRPQIDYQVPDHPFKQFQEMTRRDDGVWTFDVPERQWTGAVGKSFLLKVRLVDRAGREVEPPIDHEIPVGLPTPPKR